MARGDSFSTSPIIGAVVRNIAGEDLGTVSDVVCEAVSGRLRFALIGLYHETALLVAPWEVMQFHPGEPFVLLNVSMTELRGAPRVERTDWPHVSDSRWERDVYAYYGCRPPWDVPLEGTTSVPKARGRLSGQHVALGAVALTVVAGLLYLIASQGWTVTANEVYGLAETVKDTTVAVRDTSTDAATTAKAKAALALSKRVSAIDVNVDTTNAMVTLTGKVPTLETKELAGQIVVDTAGVRELRNLLTVDPNMRPEQERERLARRVRDLEMQTALSEALRDSPELDGAKVTVRVADGAVALTGTFTSDAQELRARELARAFPGVQRLKGELNQLQRDD